MPEFEHAISAVYCSQSEAYDGALSIARNGEAVRLIRGYKMRTLDRLFDEVSAALQFPYYFGENWGAFDECLSDLSWLEANRFTLVVLDATSILSENEDDDVGIFFRILSDIAVEFSAGPDQSARSLKVILQVESDQRDELQEFAVRAGLGQVPTIHFG